MFIEVLVISIIIGYILKGSVKNFDASKLPGLYWVFIAFLIELVTNVFIEHGIVHRGMITFIFDFIMYVLIFYFTYLNRKNPFILLMGVGFFLNALAIFFNGGAMPVSARAVVAAGLAPSIEKVNVSSDGLYTILNAHSKLWFLGDIISKPAIKPFFRQAVLSIGDIISAIGLMLFVITGMKNYSNKHKTNA